MTFELATYCIKSLFWLKMATKIFVGTATIKNGKWGKNV